MPIVRSMEAERRVDTVLRGFSNALQSEGSEDAGWVNGWVQMCWEFIVRLGWKEPPLMDESWEEIRRRLQPSKYYLILKAPHGLG